MKYLFFLPCFFLSASAFSQVEEQYNKAEYNQASPAKVPANVTMPSGFRKHPPLSADSMNKIIQEIRAKQKLINCYQFREGKFRINDSRAGGVIIAERRGGYQTESMEVLKATVRFKVNWQNDCSYTLTLDKVIRNENKVPFPEDMTIKVTIVDSKDNSSYTQEMSSSVTSGTYRTEVIKIQ